MNLIIFGGRGDVGSRVVAEALSRGHTVTAVVRRNDQIEDLPPAANARVVDLSDQEQTNALVAG